MFLTSRCDGKLQHLQRRVTYVTTYENGYREPDFCQRSRRVRTTALRDAVELANFNFDGQDFGTFDVNFTDFTFNLDWRSSRTCPGRANQLDGDSHPGRLLVSKVDADRPGSERSLAAQAVPEPLPLLFGIGGAAGMLQLARLESETSVKMMGDALAGGGEP